MHHESCLPIDSSLIPAISIWVEQAEKLLAPRLENAFVLVRLDHVA
jgi:hypothetical protein